MSERKIDPVCLIHGKKMSEHPDYGCLYCCLCFSPLTPEQCHVRMDGVKEDVCKDCGRIEDNFGTVEEAKYNYERKKRKG